MKTANKRPTPSGQQVTNSTVTTDTSLSVDDSVRGITKLLAGGNRPKRFGVRWRVDGKRKSEWYAVEKDRNKRYASLAAELARGVLHRSISRQEIAEYRAIKSAFGPVAWRDVWNGYVAHLAQVVGQAPGFSLTVAQACEQYLKDQEERFAIGKLSKDTMRHKRTKIGRFSDAFGANQLSAVTSGEITQWLEESLGLRNGMTFDGWRKNIASLYSFFLRLKKVRDNPCTEIQTRANAIEYVNILTVRDTAKLFAHALAHERVAIGRLALEAFAGMRFGSATRLDKGDINFTDKGILLPAFKLKTGKTDGRRHYIDGLPENFWEWIAQATPDTWTLTGSEWMHIKSDLFEAAGVRNPGNCLRHSFATYHLAAYKNPGLTATILCHSDQQRLWSNYKGNASSAFGARYFSITPRSAAEIAEKDVVQPLPGRRDTSPTPDTGSPKGAPAH